MNKAAMPEPRAPALLRLVVGVLAGQQWAITGNLAEGSDGRSKEFLHPDL